MTNTPTGGRSKDTAARLASKQLAKRKHPFGKAVARIRYFEVQRGLSRPASGPADDAAIAKQSPRSVKPRAKKTRRLPYHAAAKHKAAAAVSTFATAAALPVWRALGPSVIPKGQTYGKGGNNKPPVSGRCVGVSVDPAAPGTVILCSGGGGIWRTDDGGQSWTPRTDALPVLSLGALARAPSAPNVLYAGTGEGDNRSVLGQGLYRSSDGGSTWTHVPSSQLTGTGIYDIAVDSSDPLHVWVAAMNGLFESRNGGSTFTKHKSGFVWSISIHPAKPKEILVACQTGLVGTKNGGATWSNLSLPGMPPELERLEVAHAPSSPSVVYVAGASDKKAFLWRRASASGAFSAQATPSAMDVSQAWYDWCLAVAPDDANIIYWGAIELFRGKRSGTTWQWRNISSRSTGDSIHPDQHHLAFDPSHPQTLYACCDGGVFRSKDGGTAWESLNVGLSITEFEFLAQLESLDDWLIGGTQDNGTLSNAGGGHFDQIALGDGGDCAAIDGAAPVCFHSYYGMWIERAAATGPQAFRWKDVSPPHDADTYQALFYPPMDASSGVLAKAGTSVFVSTNSGDSWSEVTLSGIAANDMASALTIVSERLLYVGTVGGSVFRVKRSASGWDAASVEKLGSPRPGYLSDIVALGAGNAAELWVSSSHINGGHVFRSTDGGVTWEDRSGDLPNIPVNAIVVDPNDARIVYAATDDGVYRTQNEGKNWSDFSNGLPNAVVGDLILHQRKRVLRAGTRNRGAWEITI